MSGVNIPATINAINSISYKDNVFELRVSSYNPGDGRRYQLHLVEPVSGAIEKVVSSYMSNKEMQIFLDGMLNGMHWEAMQKECRRRLKERTA